MKTTVRCHLMDILAEVPDPRNNPRESHPLPAILGFGIVLLSGAIGVMLRLPNTDGHIIGESSLGFNRKTPCAQHFMCFKDLRCRPS